MNIICNESLHDKSGCYLTFITTGENTLSQGRIDDFRKLWPDRRSGRDLLQDYNAFNDEPLTYKEIDYLIEIIYPKSPLRPCFYTNPQTPNCRGI